MNVKLAKQLRREVNYKPGKEETKTLPTFSKDGEIFQGMVVDPKTPRAEYRQLKREVKSGNY